jgi:hypothetical protein
MNNNIMRKERMRPLITISILALCALPLRLNAQAEQTSSSRPEKAPISQRLGLHTFPAQKQTPEIQRQDEAVCYDWSRQETKYDPIAVAQQNANLEPPKGAAVQGAAAGAGLGALVGAIAGDAAKGAAAGATAGGLRAKLAQKLAARRANATVQAQEEASADFKRAFRACMEGKGYSTL